MSIRAARFPYVAREPSLGAASLAPMLPISLRTSTAIHANALVDSGAAVNVLPHSMGVQLGFDWGKQDAFVKLSGNLASVDACVVAVTTTVDPFPPVRLAFAWAKVDGMPVILGQVNFFMEFDVCFFRSRAVFDICPHGTQR